MSPGKKLFVVAPSRASKCRVVAPRRLPSRVHRPVAMSLLLLRFGELWLKSFEVRRRFTDRLITNISEVFAVQKILFKSIKSHDRIFFEVSGTDTKKASEILSKTFGLVSFSEVDEIETDRKKIKEKVIGIASDILLPKNTFAMHVKRTGTHPFTSQELERELGAAVVEKFGNKVDLTKPEKTISVEIRDNKTYLFSETIPSLGGLPLGVEGKVAVLFSKDYGKSIVASFLMMKRGCKVIPIFIALRISGKQKNAIAILSEYDPIIKRALIKTEKTAFFAAWKNKAKALIFTDSLAEIMEKKPRQFDKKTGVFALYPLAGFDEKTLKDMYGTICR